MTWTLSFREGIGEVNSTVELGRGLHTLKSDDDILAHLIVATHVARSLTLLPTISAWVHILQLITVLSQ